MQLHLVFGLVEHANHHQTYTYSCIPYNLATAWGIPPVYTAAGVNPPVCSAASADGSSGVTFLIWGSFWSVLLNYSTDSWPEGSCEPHS